MRWCLAAFMGVVLPLAAEDQKNPGGERTYHEMSKESKPWWDADTGFGLPHRLGTFKMQGWREYTNKSLGCSVRMVDDEAQARADVYVYPCPVPSTTEGEIQQAIGDELGRSLSGVYAMQKRGDYSDVKRQDATMQTVMLFPGGSLPLIGCVITMKIHDKTIIGDDGQEVTSWHGITIFKGKYIKVRYTFPSSKGKEGEKTLNDFEIAWKWCLREPGFRADILPKLRAYRADPLSKEGEEAAGAVYTYAEKSPFTSLTVGGRLDAILGEASKASKGANLHVVRAFIVGSIDACLRNGTSSDVEAGAAEVVHVYGLMQKQHPDFKVGLIEELAEAVRQKRATAWLNISVKKT